MTAKAEAPITDEAARLTATLISLKEERDALRAHILSLLAALRPFATAKMCSTDGDPLADWARQHESEGVELIWDPENSRATLTIGQFKRAKSAYTKAKELIDASDKEALPAAKERGAANRL